MLSTAQHCSALLSIALTIELTTSSYHERTPPADLLLTLMLGAGPFDVGLEAPLRGNR